MIKRGRWYDKREEGKEGELRKRRRKRRKEEEEEEEESKC